MLSRLGRRLLVATSLVAGVLACQDAQAQFGLFGNRVGVVGGVSVDADGTVRSATAQEQQGWLKQLRDTAQQPQGRLAQDSPLRMVSLSKLQQAIEQSLAEQQPLSEEVLYLAGLQRIEYIFVYPEERDIVLAGPAEGWVVRQDASVVGEKSGRPVLQLEDLLTALRNVKATQQEAMSVSIDPTPEGERRLNQLLSQVQISAGFNPAGLESAMREAFGPQQVKFTAIDRSTRTANTLVAADYRMKRLAMNLESSPVAGLPSYMEMIRNTGATKGTQPRWWIACDYDAILHSQDLSAWKISGLGVKAMTEQQFVDEAGNRQQTGKVDPIAKKWADLFTAKFDELCRYNPAFGDLRNVMDLSIVATVIEGQQLEGLAGCDLSLLKGQSGNLETPAWKTPKTITPECSFVRGRSGWTVSASGGVEINPWKIVSLNAKPDDEVAKTRLTAAPKSDQWWWD